MHSQCKHLAERTKEFLQGTCKYADVNEIISEKVRSETGAMPWVLPAICILNTNDGEHSPRRHRREHYRIIIKLHEM